MKRLFTGRSSKNLDAEAAGDRKTASQPRAGGEPPRSKLLTAGYPVVESDLQKLGEFLERCNYCNCKKQIADNSDVFMYGDLGAFCSVECRDNQIARDQSANGKRANSKERRNKGQSSSLK